MALVLTICGFLFAGLEGIEPPFSVLETDVLPLNDRPSLEFTNKLAVIIVPEAMR
jgi:hypothetical protein